MISCHIMSRRIYTWKDVDFYVQSWKNELFRCKHRTWVHCSEIKVGRQTVLVVFISCFSSGLPVSKLGELDAVRLPNLRNSRLSHLLFHEIVSLERFINFRPKCIFSRQQDIVGKPAGFSIHMARAVANFARALSRNKPISHINPTIHLFHIPQCTTLEQNCVHFCSKMLYCVIWDRYIVGFVRLGKFHLGWAACLTEFTSDKIVIIEKITQNDFYYTGAYFLPVLCISH